MSKELAVALGVLIIGGFFGGLVFFTVKDLGWKRSAGLWAFVLAATAALGAAAFLLGWGLTR